MLQRISKRWHRLCVVAAPGPSLTEATADRCAGLPTIAVNDAWRRVPFAEVLYAADAQWWDHHDGCRDFDGERWSTHGLPNNDKRPQAERYGLSLVRGDEGEGFSLDPVRLHYGSNSGFQAINLALHMLGGEGTILLIGFDMRVVEGRRHFFGNHPPAMHRETDYGTWFAEFDMASQRLPATLRVINCTPGSALPSFPRQDLEAALCPTE